jgi:small subunit ribosomal protein S1
MSNRLDDMLSASFVCLLNASHVQDVNSDSRKGELYYPKPGDFMVGVMVSGTVACLNVAVGADRLATLRDKELLPLDSDSTDRLEQADPPRPRSVGVVAGPAMVEEDARK